MALNMVIGNKTKILFTIMPEESLQASTLQAPSNVNITLSAAATSGATSLTVTALSGPVPIGTPITFTSGTAPNLITRTVVTSASVATGATAIPIQAAPAAIANGATGTYTALLELLGGTSADQQIQNTDVETLVFGDALGYSDGLVTKAGWSISYSFNALPSDPGYQRLAYASQNAAIGVRGWVKMVQPPPAGYTTGNSIEGLIDCMNFSLTTPADGIVTGKVEFKGRGTPTLKGYS